MYGVFITLRIGVPGKKSLDNTNGLLAVMCMIQHLNFLRIIMVLSIFFGEVASMCVVNPSVATEDFWG